jgi:hypothetical protein
MNTIAVVLELSLIVQSITESQCLFDLFPLFLEEVTKVFCQKNYGILLVDTRRNGNHGRLIT